MMYMVMLKFLQLLGICIMCHSLLIIQEGHGCILLEVNMMFLIDLRRLRLSWKIRLVGRLRF